MEITKENLLTVPETYGVYKFLKDGLPIYIGKSVNLKHRLLSYLIATGIKTRKMVSQAQTVEFVKVNSEIEALLLESLLIKKFQPKYNVISKDDKHALYIAITDEVYPRLITVRKNSDIKIKKIYGPFPSSIQVKRLLKIIRRIFPYSDHLPSKRTCLYNQIGLCNPCPSKIEKTLDGKEKSLLTLEFKKNIRYINLLLCRKFKLLERKLNKKMQTLSKLKNYETALEVRKQIETLNYITSPRVNEGYFIENPDIYQDKVNQKLKELKRLLFSNGIKVGSLKRIECFDVAHIQGKLATASMVVFIDGFAEKSQYRRFKIRQPKTLSDYDNLGEIARRRISNIDKWGRPDLVIVDGGLGQVRIFHKLFLRHNLNVIGIAKNPDRIVFSSGTKIRLKGEVHNLVASLRDEAHRFARRYHHLLVQKDLIPS